MVWKSMDQELPTIISVDALDGDCFDITLSSGHTILLELGDRVKEPAFAQLIENRLLDRPLTDGKRLYWVGGPSYTVAEIFAMLAHDRTDSAKTQEEEGNKK